MFDFEKQPDYPHLSIATMFIFDGKGESIVHTAVFSENGMSFSTRVYTNGCESRAWVETGVIGRNGKQVCNSGSLACCGLDFDV